MNREIPSVLAKLNEIDIDYEADGIDFEPYQQFMSQEEQAEWLVAWTGNKNARLQLLIFGQDGTGGYAAIWPVNEGKPILDQPIVFMGSEGQVGVVAACFSDYLWLLASGHGPCEAVQFLDANASQNMAFLEFAEQHASTPKAGAVEIVAKAVDAYPSFNEMIDGLCC